MLTKNQPRQTRTRFTHLKAVPRATALHTLREALREVEVVVEAALAGLAEEAQEPTALLGAVTCLGDHPGNRFRDVMVQNERHVPASDIWWATK